MFEPGFRNIDDVLRKEAGCTTELDYTEQLSWLLFLKYLAGLEEDRATEAALDAERRKCWRTSRRCYEERVTDSCFPITGNRPLLNLLSSVKDSAALALSCGK